MAVTCGVVVVGGGGDVGNADMAVMINMVTMAMIKKEVNATPHRRSLETKNTKVFVTEPPSPRFLQTGSPFSLDYRPTLFKPQILSPYVDSSCLKTFELAALCRAILNLIDHARRNGWGSMHAGSSGIYIFLKLHGEATGALKLVRA